uniref:Uncharacterized protein n=1 Tax=Arion vulgaris TaxID=1028688 RepID=A0A0B6YQD5_9EUPU
MNPTRLNNRKSKLCQHVAMGHQLALKCHTAPFCSSGTQNSCHYVVLGPNLCHTVDLLSLNPTDLKQHISRSSEDVHRHQAL